MDFRAEIDEMVGHPSFFLLQWVPFSVINQIDWNGIPQDQELTRLLDGKDRNDSHIFPRRHGPGPPLPRTERYFGAL